MCLAIPAQIIKVNGDTASVDFGGIKRNVNITLIDSPKIGDYVLIHVGYAIHRISQEEAQETLKIWEGMLKE
jgi:hydrogenase expression/formation protein HypC